MPTMHIFIYQHACTVTTMHIPHVTACTYKSYVAIYIHPLLMINKASYVLFTVHYKKDKNASAVDPQ